MTANNILQTTLTLMFGTAADSAEYEPYFLNILNIILSECYAINNALRVCKGQEAMTQMPLIEDLGEAVPFEDELVRIAVPYGCAGYIYTDDDKSVASDYKNKYEYEKSRAFSAAYEEIDDVYK